MKIALCLPALLLVACATNGHDDMSAKVVTAASAAERAALIDRMKTLEGSWEAKGPDGKMGVASVFTVTSAGSAVREILLPGSEHEMTNMYTMDGPTLLMTHYCAMGNQPRMRAHAGSDPNTIRFESDSVSNLRKPDEMYMGSMTLTIVDKDHIRTDWSTFNGDKSEPGTTFELTRKK